MKNNIFKYLAQHYSAKPNDVDRVIIPAFLLKNKIKVDKNQLIKSYIILEHDIDHSYLLEFISEWDKANVKFDLEDLIELFEFVVSPSDKIINGAVYTPAYIREYIVEQGLSKKINNKDILCADIACGCGGFLLTLTENLKSKHSLSYFDIYKNNIYGLDITDYSIQRSKILLTLKALIDGEDCDNFVFNLTQGNTLDFDWRANFPAIKTNDGFDIIVGNPPYVCSRNMDEQSLLLLDRWEVTKSGHPDLYIPFFQIGLENLNVSGLLGYITVNTFFKSINGRALRQYFARNNIKLIIINFGSEQIFKDRSTYTCICFLTKDDIGKVYYNKSFSDNISEIQTKDFYEYDYSMLNHFDGWNLVSSQRVQTFIDKIESTGSSFASKYVTRNGIATLKNHIYKFTPFDQDKHFFYMESDGETFAIEKSICKEVINSNKISSPEDIESRKEQIIFPYDIEDGKPKIITQTNFQKYYPKAYKYLLSRKDELATRDKGNKEYEKWFAYGRNQSLDIYSYKLFFPHICERPKFILCTDKDLLFYNGIAVISDSVKELKILKKILESDIFYNYVKYTSKDYSSGYISLSKNYIKNFGICDFSKEEEKRFLSLEKEKEINKFLKKKYNLETIEQYE